MGRRSNAWGLFSPVTWALILAGGTASAAPVSLSMSMFTWNTEYYAPKVGDMNAVLRAHDLTQQALCRIDVINIFFQESPYGYVNPETCLGGRDNDKAAPFTVFREDLLHHLSQCPTPAEWGVKCGELHGMIGTKGILCKYQE